jgi:type I restriction enzyme S subunit
MQRVAALGTGHTPSRTNPFYWGGSIPWIALPDARDNHGRYIETTVQTITEAGLANSAARLHDANTVCLSRTASVGYVTIMAQSMATSQDFATWTCTEALLPEYLMYALLAEGDELRSFGMGSIHTTIYFPQLRALHIALPPLPEQTEVVRRLEGLLRRVEQQESELERVRSLLISVRHAFLTKAVAGELVSAVLDEGTPMALRRRIAARAKARPSKARRAPRGSGPRSLVPIEEPRQKEGSMDKTRLDVPPELLSRLVAEHGGSIRTEVLWRASGLRVDEFYKLLREEFASKRLKQSEEKDKIVDAN